MNPMVRMAIVVIVASATLGLMLPWAVAFALRTKRPHLIFWINLLFGPFIIGWLVAAVMAWRIEKGGWTHVSA